MSGRRAVGVLAVASLASVLAIPAAAEHDRTPCGDVTVVFARGSGQDIRTEDGEVLTFFARVDERLGDVLVVNQYELGTEPHGGESYPAVGSLSAMAGALFRLGSAYLNSVRSGVTELVAYLGARAELCPDETFVVGGYSQGAQVTGSALFELDRSLRDRIAFVALFGDPKLHLPEGRGLYPAACRDVGRQISPWRRGNPSCFVTKGILGAREPYVPDDIASRVGSWCDLSDHICTGSLLLIVHSSHGVYAEDGAEIDDAAVEVGNAVVRRHPTQGDVDIAADPAPQPLPSGVDPAPNPDLGSDRCGLRLALVVDTSSSITDAQATEEVRRGVGVVVDALAGTPSQLRITSFRLWPVVVTPWTRLDDDVGRASARNAPDALVFSQGFEDNSGTNWEAALRDVLGQEADVVVFITDGQPNTWGVGLESRSSEFESGDVEASALAAGEEAANLLKEGGARIIGVGVGDVRTDPLRRVSGSLERSDYFVGDFASLGGLLSQVAGQLCESSVLVEHLVDGAPTAGALYTVQADRSRTSPIETASDGTARYAVEGEVDQVTITGPDDPAVVLDEVACDRGGGQLDVQMDRLARQAVVELGGTGSVTCVFRWLTATASDVIGELVEGRTEDASWVSLEPIPRVDWFMDLCLVQGGAGTRIEPGACDIRVVWDPAGGLLVLYRDPDCATCAGLEGVTVAPGRNGVRIEHQSEDLASFDELELGLDLAVVDAQPGIAGWGNTGVRAAAHHGDGTTECVADVAPPALGFASVDVVTGDGC